MNDTRRWYATWLLVAVSGAAVLRAEQGSDRSALRARLRPVSHHVPVGYPVWMQFWVENGSDDPVTLRVPGAEPQIPLPEMGLPVSHVFSGNSGSGVSVTTESGRRVDRPVGYRSVTEAPIVIVAAQSMVGTRIDLRDYFPVLRGAGQYRITWNPYGGELGSEVVAITVAPRKQVEIVTDEGTMTVRLFYEDAPLHVDNFLELAQSGFYNNKTFHGLERGYMLLGGCPRGDGTGIRSDGKRIPAEFNSRPHQKGSLSMALLEDDPDSASSQFFICNTRQKDWDGRYTVFGQLVEQESFETLDRLMATPADDSGRPEHPLYMRTLRVVDAPADMP